ncbi:MAG: hypothetical protein NXH90_13400 [Flavobacteriaceae bacterium]|nr:hypothetical protein [Flavobacteriaceae bacterium]
MGKTAKLPLFNPSLIAENVRVSFAVSCKSVVPSSIGAVKVLVAKGGQEIVPGGYT